MQSMTLGDDLPVLSAIPALKSALSAGRSAVLEAPPGAGKTTMVPLTLKDEGWLSGKSILMLEPRRIAARAAANRMASLLGEKVGATVGYRVRQETRVSAKTRIEVLTEALLTRRLQHDPALEGVGLVIFDEFHERSLDADLGLALTLETKAALNPDLRILVMSATLDGARVAAALGDADVVRSEGRLFPVETLYGPVADMHNPAPAMASAIRRALSESEGSVLAFLPGEAEIRRTEKLLHENALPRGVLVMPLYGNLPFDAQAAAIAPTASGERKIVLATAIAETSLTIPDVRIVVDSGLVRQSRFDAATGMTRLVTERLSLASAEQRRGRAGRTAPGSCYRLWTEESHRALPAYAPPEIMRADLAPLALDLAAWGNADPSAYTLLDQPPAAAFAQSLELLRELEALDTANRITSHGRDMNALGMHPRLSHMLLKGNDMGLGETAATVAGLLSERDILRVPRDRPDCDLRARLHVMAGDAPPPGLEADRGALARARENAKQWMRQLNVDQTGIDADAAGHLLALAYPDRIALRRGLRGSFRLRNGRGAMMTEADALAAEGFLAIGTLDQGVENARVFLAAPISRSEIESMFGDQIEQRRETVWEARSQSVQARQLRLLGALVLEERWQDDASPDDIAAAMLDGIRRLGVAKLPWTDDLRQLQARVGFLRGIEGESTTLPDICDEALSETLEEWLSPFLGGFSRAAQLPKLDLKAALEGHIGWDKMRRLDTEAPTHITVPTGSRLSLDYSSGAPVLEVRLQEMFGEATTPTVARGRVPVMLHLLSPGRRPVQVTRDLAGFWKGSYQDVKKDLKGRYPKHRWPDDPLSAQPTARAKRPGERE